MIILIKGTIRLKLSTISKAFALIGLLFCCSIYASGQACDCPPIDTCAPCAGGITSLTLRFNGLVTSTITASDNSGVVFSGVVNPGGEFTFTGTNPNEKFLGATIAMRVNGLPSLPSIPSNCAGNSFVGSTIGSFTIMAGLSKNGGALCCSAATMEDVKPVINCPPNKNVDLLSGCSMPVTWTIPIATDNCSVDTVFSLPAHGDVFQLGPTLVVYTAKDPFGNSQTCSFVVTVSDKIKPKILNPPDPITVSANGSCEAVVEWTEPTATDNCSVEMESDYSPGDIFQIGPTTVTYTAVDPSGNKETYSFEVTVVDTESPVIKDCPEDIVVFVDDECEVAVTWVAPTATDNCYVDLTPSHASGSKFSLGDTTVVYTAEDLAGNITTCSFKVSVKTTRPPDITTGCPSDISAEADGTGVAIVTWDEPQATASCGDVIVSKSHEPGSPFRPGPTTVTYSFADESGNTSTCSFNVVVESPEISFTVSQVVTPDGNGTNDFWELLNIERFPDNTVTVVDRWGNTVYKASGYDNKTVFWDGTSVNGGKVPTGTYFYTVEVRSLEETVHKKGFLEVIQ